MTPHSETYGLSIIEELVLIRLGHLTPRPFSLTETARLLRVSRQRVSQIEQAALRRLREALPARLAADAAEPCHDDGQHSDLVALSAVNYVDSEAQRPRPSSRT